MYRYTHHRRAEHAPVKNVAGLIDLKNRAVLSPIGLRSLHSLVKVRVEMLAEWLDPLDAKPAVWNVRMKTMVLKSRLDDSVLE